MVKSILALVIIVTDRGNSMSKISLVLSCFLVVIISSIGFCTESTGSEKPEDYSQIAGMGRGFIIWESRRTGNWRLWKIKLDGTGLMQLTPDEKGRDHYRVHISPDGKRLLYLSYPEADKTDNLRMQVHLMNTDGTNDRVIISDSMMYLQHTAIWIDNDRFIYINNDGVTCERSISKNTEIPLTLPGEGQLHYLINRTKTYATSLGPTTFAPYNAQTKTVTATAELGGCMTYFTGDGVWGFWMGAGGGPINRYKLATGEISPILKSKDDRMPKERNYLYFPMISNNRRLITFGASPNQHDHDVSDYDIFAAPIDPQTLEVTGRPVRYTFDPKTDRYPDVFITDLDLGSYRGEAPFSVKFSPKDRSASYIWDFGDGTTGSGTVVSHKYTRPGMYDVEAKFGNNSIHGRVSVESATPPKVLSAALRGVNEVLVTFNEPVNLSKSRFVVNGKHKISSVSIAKDKVTASFTISEVKKGDKLSITSVTDLAQVPNKMLKTTLEIKTFIWPSSKQGLVLQWENGRSGCISGNGVRYKANNIGRAGLDNRYALKTAGGHYAVTGVEEQILKACQKTNQLAVEFNVTTQNLDQQGPARLITFSSGTGTRNFTVGQQQDNLIFRLRTPETGDNGSSPETVVCKLTAGKPIHVIISYRSGELIGYVNGKQVMKTDAVKGDFSNWTAQHLLVGDEWQGQRVWQGKLEGIAIYNRIFNEVEARKNYESYVALHPYKYITPLRVSAKLTRASHVPTLSEINPYREALVVNEYEVQQVLQGKCKARKIRVAQWAILGGDELVNTYKTGDVFNLRLEPMDQNPQVDSIYASDSLEPDPGAVIYFDTAM